MKDRGVELRGAKRLGALEEANRRLGGGVVEQALDLPVLEGVVGRRW